MTLFAPITGTRVPYEKRDIGTSYVDLLSAVASATTLESLLVSNKTASPVTCTFAKVSGANTTIILPTISIAANDVYLLKDHHVVLKVGDKFQIKAGTISALDASLTVIEGQTR